MKQQQIEFHGEAIKILNKMLDNYDYKYTNQYTSIQDTSQMYL